MKSIRGSLIVYVLVLLTVALGAVSWFSYRTTAQSLRERQRDSQQMIEAQYTAQSQAVKADLDRRILREAQRLAGTARAVAVHNEELRLIGAAAWIVQTANPPIPYDVLRTEPKFLVLIEASDPLFPEASQDHAQEFFQTYLTTGQPVQRSESMGNQWFTLDEERQKKAVPLTEYFDDTELKPGVKVRRVTLKAPVAKRGGAIPISRPWWSGRPGLGPLKGGPLAKGLPVSKGPPPVTSFPFPTVFIQYASDVGPTEAKIRVFQQQRDDQLANLASTIEGDLAQLRTRMLWIGLATLAALSLGGYLVICLGLAPLSKMSEAVSQVSTQNFHLPLETENLPNELQPIAARLVEVLEHLQKAFAREKQGAADISHELRTPLAALLTNLELGLRKMRSPEEYRELLEECFASGQHMYRLVERLLTLARLDAGADQYRPAQVDVIEVALACADLIRPLARARNLDLRLNLRDPITTQTDPNKLREVLTNLLHNAVEYNKPDGSIELTVERTNGHVRFEVRDSGIGIEPQALESIFERFFRADASRHADTPHAGLGLSIVKSYVDLMGGTIRVESSAAGTAFIVELPFIEPAPSLETAVRATPELARR